MDSLDTLTQAAHQAQRQGQSPQAHAYMAKAYALALASAQRTQHIQDWDTAARLYSHQLLLQWSFAPAQSLYTHLHGYYQQHVAPLPRYYSGQQLRLSQRVPGPLRVAFLSPDLRSCSAATLIADLFTHAPRNLDYTVFSTAPHVNQDPTHERLQTYMTHTRQAQWFEASTWHSQEMAAHIYDQHIDILIDLAGHTSLSNLQVVARQPAPLQVTGLTFNGGVGLGDRCLRATDAYCTATPSPYPEDLPLFLPSWISHDAAAAEPPAPLSQMPPQQGYQLGCAHHPGRLSEACLRTWGRLLQALPAHSQLRLKHSLYADPSNRQRVLDQLLSEGVKPQAIVFETESDYPEYLRFYDTLDLVLDPFPYHGGLVSCDALWRGVPFVTLSTWMHGGASLLHQVQCTEGIAHSPEAYITQAKALLADTARRRQWRQTLPQTLAQTLAGQPHRWTQSLFTALERYILP